MVRACGRLDHATQGVTLEHGSSDIEDLLRHYSKRLVRKLGIHLDPSVETHADLTRSVALWVRLGGGLAGPAARNGAFGNELPSERFEASAKAGEQFVAHLRAVRAKRLAQRSGKAAGDQGLNERRVQQSDATAKWHQWPQRQQKPFRARADSADGDRGAGEAPVVGIFGGSDLRRFVGRIKVHPKRGVRANELSGDGRRARLVRARCAPELRSD